MKSLIRRLDEAVVVGLVVISAAAAAGAQTPSGNSDAEARFNAGLTHLRDGRPKLALEEFQRAIKQDPKNPYFHKGLGLAYATLKRFDDAVDAFRKALELNPYYTDVRNDLGMALVLAGKRQAGKAEFLAAFNDPTNPTPEISSRNLGQAYFEENNHAEAANWFRSSLNRNKAYPDAYLGLADALVALGRAEEAMTTLETGASEVPASTGIQLALGEAYYRAGRFADARARLEDARKQDPTGADARRAAELLKHFPK
jgi:type IV pilus assembly protein PilF